MTIILSHGFVFGIYGYLPAWVMFRTSAKPSVDVFQNMDLLSLYSAAETFYINISEGRKQKFIKEVMCERFPLEKHKSLYKDTKDKEGIDNASAYICNHIRLGRMPSSKSFRESDNRTVPIEDDRRKK